jgi:hypothetical protein
MIELLAIVFLYFMGMACFYMLLTEMKARTKNATAELGLVFICVLWPIFVMLSLIFAPFKK